MSTWTDRIRNHNIWQQLEMLGPTVDRALEREEPHPTAFASLNRMKTVLIITGKRLSEADPDLISIGPLDNIASLLQAATSETQAYITNGNEGHLANANSHIDGVLANLAQILVPASINEIGALRESADAYRTSFESNLQRAQGSLVTYHTELVGVQEKLATLTADVSAEKQRLSSLASEHQAQFSGAQDTRSKDYLEAQTSRQEKFTALLSEYAQKLTEQNADFQRQRDQVESLQKAELAKLTESHQSAAADILNKIQLHLEQVEKLVGVIGNLGVTSGYQKAAKSARQTAIIWQGIALVSLGAIIFVAYKAFLPLVQGSFTWSSFAGRVFVSLTVGVLAAYAISQADKYQQIERRSQKFALELEAIGPYLASLPQEKQDDFRIRVGDKSFGVSGDLVDSSSTDSPKSVIDLALKSKELTNLIVNIIKATKGI